MSNDPRTGTATQVKLCLGRIETVNLTICEHFQDKAAKDEAQSSNNEEHSVAKGDKV